MRNQTYDSELIYELTLFSCSYAFLELCTGLQCSFEWPFVLWVLKRHRFDLVLFSALRLM